MSARRGRQEDAAAMAVALGMIERAARQGRAAPGNAEIAVACGYESRASAAGLVARLAQAGTIAVERFQTARVITIVATGQRTRAPDTPQRPHWSTRGGRPGRRMGAVAAGIETPLKDFRR